jgi:hypothetical protein
MAKRERLHLSAHTSIETGRDWNGRFYIVYAKNASVFLRCPKEVRKWLKLPAKIPSREAFDSWIASLEAADAEREKKRDHLPEEGMSEELLATGFGPEVHALDESDPNYQTRTVL